MHAGVSSLKHHRHSPTEITAKLVEAAALSADGKSQDEIARALGVSVMTFHRWRKAQSLAGQAMQTPVEDSVHNLSSDQFRQISNLQLENSRLRRLVTDLLLEKLSLEETHSKRALA